MSEAATTLAGIAIAALVLVIRSLWRLAERVSRLEGRLNGRRRE